MKSLIESVNSFVALEQRSKLTHLERLCQEVVNEIDKLCKQLLICEKNGYKRSQIVEVLRPTQAIFQKSPLVWRMQNWPRGYPGDYETMEYICDAINKAPENTVEYWCEEYALSCPAAQQYRNLVNYQALQVIETFRIASQKPRVLSLACGSCRDIWSIQIFLKEFSSGEIILTDLDSEALEFSRARLKSIEGKLQFLQGNLIQVLPTLESSGEFDLVVAGALFDYLSKPVAKYLIKHVYKYLLKPNGKFIFTNIVKGNSYRTFVEYFGNLILIERDEKEVLDICRQLGLNEQGISFKKEESDLRLIVEITKK